MDAHEKLSPIGLALCGFVVIIVITMAVFFAIPNIFFGYRSSDNERTIHMTRLASNIGTVCMSLHEFESTVIDAIVTSIAAEYEEQGVTIDHIEVESRFDEESLQWFTAINSAAHAQNLEEMSVDQIKELCAARLAYTFSLFGEEKITLHITIHKLDPNEWMEKLSLTDDAKNWAGALFEVFSESGAMNRYADQFSDATDYAELSLEAKVAYTFLLNRFQLSRRKGWVNDHGEVFVIFPRKALAKELRICEQRVTAAFRQLVEAQLVWEKRCGRGDANQIYLAKVKPIDDPAYECAPFCSEEHEDCGLRTADFEALGKDMDVAGSQESQNRNLKNSESCGSRTANWAAQEPQELLLSKKEERNKEGIQKEVSQSVGCERARDTTDGQDEEAELTDILDACELSYFPPETALVFENAIERLYYSDSLRVGNATLPRARVRKRLRCLDHMTLRDAAGKLAANTEKSVRNSTAYTMATIFNAITESESDLMVDPYLNSLALPGEHQQGEVTQCCYPSSRNTC